VRSSPWPTSKPPTSTGRGAGDSSKGAKYSYPSICGQVGTAIVAAMNSGGIAGLRPILMAFAVGMLALIWLVAAVLAVPYLLRRVQHPDSPWRDLRHAVVGALYATVPAGLLVLATSGDVAALNVLGALLFALLVGFWLVVTANTLSHIRTGLTWRR